MSDKRVLLIRDSMDVLKVSEITGKLESEGFDVVKMDVCNIAAMRDASDHMAEAARSIVLIQDVDKDVQKARWLDSIRRRKSKSRW